MIHIHTHIYNLLNPPPLFDTTGILILDIDISPYSTYQFLYLFALFYSTDEPAYGDKPSGVATTHNNLLRHKNQLDIGLYHCSIRGLSKKQRL